jgi:hypothetical protein
MPKKDPRTKDAKKPKKDQMIRIRKASIGID